MVIEVLVQQIKAKFIALCIRQQNQVLNNETKPQSKFLNPYVDSWAVPFSANLSLFPKCQGALEERPGVCAPPVRVRVLPVCPPLARPPPPDRFPWLSSQLGGLGDPDLVLALRTLLFYIFIVEKPNGMCFSFVVVLAISFNEGKLR